MNKRGSLFSSNEHVWFEMANCETDTSGVKRFANEEIVSNKNFLSEVSYSYDEAFWEILILYYRKVVKGAN
jgi:hypothetical protein